MTRILPKFFVPVFLMVAIIFSLAAQAASESTTIQLLVTHNNFVRLIGTVVGAERTFSVRDIKPPNGRKPFLTLGTLGLESNSTGSCTIDFSTQNTFKLRHTINNRKLTRYILKYRNKKINRKKHTITLPCNSPATPLKFARRGKFLKKKRIRSGVYSDVVTITVTTQ